MRTIFFITFSIASMVYGQTILNGKYCATPELSGVCIDFKESNSFLYTRPGCLSSSAGRGTYKIRKDSLHLFFDNAEGLNVNRFEILSSTPATNNRTTIEVHLVYDDSLVPIYGTLIITKNVDQEYPEMLKGTLTDSLGNGKFIMNVTSDSIRLVSREVGMESFYVSLAGNRNYKINGTLTQDNTKAIKNQTWTYKIVSLKKGRLTLSRGKDDNDKLIIWDFSQRK